MKEEMEEKEKAEQRKSQIRSSFRDKDDLM